MQIISINVSQPQSVEYEGNTISTGIFKKPVAGKVVVYQNFVAGDAQVDLVNHGGSHKAVYAFAYEHYDYWRTKLKNPNLKPGAFGENLTLSGFDELQLCIGDQFRIGECLLEISQPRVPCYKLGIALNSAKAPKLFTQNFRTGAYLRVIKEGVIEAGDVVLKVAEAPHSVSVGTLFRAYFDKKFAGANEVFKRAVNLETLSPEWREKMVARLAAGD